MDKQGVYFLQKYKDAEKRIEQMQHENKMLKNRCSALTNGTMCMFCPYECENRSKEYRGHVND